LQNKTLNIAIVVGEASGDNLGAALMQAILDKIESLSGYVPGVPALQTPIQFMGIGGDKMKALGFHSFFDMERLAVMGIMEPLRRLPELLKMRRFIIQFFTQHPPDIYIGIDAPDFNLGIARALRKKGVKTMHYVSPTIWAWRANRIKKIVQSLDHILLIFPFEADIYRHYNLQISTPIGYDYIGHPLADTLPFYSDKQKARLELQGLSKGLDGLQMNPIIAILPGSRTSEIQSMGPEFIKTADILYKKNNNIIFIAAMVNQAKAQLFESLLNTMAKQGQIQVPIIICVDKTRVVLQACDTAMVVSGTATLEAALIKRPFIVGYKIGFWQYQLAKWLIKLKYIALPNIIANKSLVTEYIQYDLNPEKMAEELLSFLAKQNPRVIKMIQEFEHIHTMLKQNGSQKAAEAVLKCISNNISNNISNQLQGTRSFDES